MLRATNQRCEACDQAIELAGLAPAGVSAQSGMVMWMGTCGCRHKPWVVGDAGGEWRVYTTYSSEPIS